MCTNTANQDPCESGMCKNCELRLYEHPYHPSLTVPLPYHLSWQMYPARAIRIRRESNALHRAHLLGKYTNKPPRLLTRGKLVPDTCETSYLFIL